jgi:hypothetical protein
LSEFGEDISEPEWTESYFKKSEDSPEPEHTSPEPAAEGSKGSELIDKYSAGNVPSPNELTAIREELNNILDKLVTEFKNRYLTMGFANEVEDPENSDDYNPNLEAVALKGLEKVDDNISKLKGQRNAATQILNKYDPDAPVLIRVKEEHLKRLELRKAGTLDDLDYGDENQEWQEHTDMVKGKENLDRDIQNLRNEIAADRQRLANSNNNNN